MNFEQRARELVSKMTLAEKISQLKNDAPAIERLGVPAYNWWNEGLHGVARAGVATVFPQAITMAASFDEELLDMDVYNADTGDLLGKIKKVETYPASKVYTVRGQREYLIPAIPQVFIQSVDLDANRMDIHVIEGMATDEI